MSSPEYQVKYHANTLRSGLLLGAVVLLLTAVPMPLSTLAEGVVWLPPDSEVRAGADATVIEFVAAPGSQVQAGELLLRLADPTLVAEEKILRAELAEANARFHAARSADPVEAQILHEDVLRIEAGLALAAERVAALQVRSERAGRFIVDKPDDLIGHFVRTGELLAFVADNAANTVVVAVSQDEIGLTRARTNKTTLRFAEQLDEVIPATLVRATPAASNRLPSAALGGLGGGRFATDPADELGLVTLEDVFQLELAAATPATRFGSRAFVRFDHGYQPLALQWYRQLRQVFLRQLEV
jgi:putative peptide zinc metalloprotease protein